MRQISIQHQFDSFCKAVVRNETRNLIRNMKRRSDRERVFSELTIKEYVSLAALDAYPSGQSSFNVAGHIVTVRHGKLAEAIAALPQDQRDIILLFFFLRMTDSEIGECLRLPRSTVQHKRTCSYREMKSFLDSED